MVSNSAWKLGVRLSTSRVVPGPRRRGDSGAVASARSGERWRGRDGGGGRCRLADDLGGRVDKAVATSQDSCWAADSNVG